MPLDTTLLTAAIGALVGCPVVTYDDYVRNPSKDVQPLNTEAFHKSVLIAPESHLVKAGPGPQFSSLGPNPGSSSSSTHLATTGSSSGIMRGLSSTLSSSTLFLKSSTDTTSVQPSSSTSLQVAARPLSIFVKTLSGRTITIATTTSTTIARLKEDIAEKADVPPEEQRLIWGGKELWDDWTIGDYSIQQDSTIHLALRIIGGVSAMYLPSDFLDSGYDYDFTTVNDDGYSFSRGGEKYTRPCGWLRYALKVNGKYGEDSWLGSTNAAGEWPVSYHGTSKINAVSIAEEGFKLARGSRFAYGKGIYSSPDHKIAEAYAPIFSVGSKRYKVIFQNRVNPTNLKKIPNIDYWISPADADIRPYGLCVKEI